MEKLDNLGLAPGMVLARDVYDRNTKVLIVSAGITLTGELVDRLRQYPKMEIFVKDLTAELQDEHEKRIWAKMDFSHQRTLTRAKNILANAGEHPPDPTLLNLMVNDLIEQIELSTNVLLNLSHIKVYDDYLYSHVVNVAMLALIIGKQLRLKPDEQHNLGIAALLHDYGMVKLDREVYDHSRDLSPEDWEQVKQHPAYGVEMLQNAEQITPEILRGVLEHHERLDGSGYPYQKRDQDLGWFGRIIAVADVYDACISKRKYRDPLTPTLTLQTLLRGSQLFDLQVLQAFVAAMSIYPIGSFIRLNTGEIGKIVGCNQNEPFRPDIQVLFNCELRKITHPYRLRLVAEENQQCFIKGYLEGEDLQTVRTILGE
jgi:HD-GYP domain-containing protein (c-di-GMP phosphodiesterase class II)